MGGWGTNCNGNNPGCVRDLCFPEIAPFGVGSAVVGHNLTFISSLEVANFLPSGGKPGELSQDHAPPTEKTDAGVLAGQTTALALNLACSEVDPSAFQPQFPDPIWEGSLAEFKFIGAGPCNDLHVDVLLDAIEERMGGEDSGIMAIDDATFAELSSCVATINECFNDGNQCAELMFDP